MEICKKCGGMHLHLCGTGMEGMDAAVDAANERQDWTCIMCDVPRAPFYGAWCRACVWRAKNPPPLPGRPLTGKRATKAERSRLLDPRKHAYCDDGGHCVSCGFPAQSHGEAIK